jgi:hypothetical protein
MIAMGEFELNSIETKGGKVIKCWSVLMEKVRVLSMSLGHCVC